jgi:TolB-like protein/DNA-binding winged helix-turn-helix (wHTH) protein
MKSGVSEARRDRFVYRIGDLDVDAGRAVVLRAGQPLPLPKLSFELLLALIERAPDIASLDDLLDRVWAGVVVSPETVSQRVKLLRDALGDDPKEPRYVAGVRGRGYRLIPAVERVPEQAGSSEPSVVPSTDPSPEAVPASIERAAPRWRPSTVVLVVLAVAALGAGLWALRSSREAAAPDAVATQAVADLPPRSIAVLPFREIGNHADDKVLAEGVAESILHQLSAVDGLTVIARTSSFLFGSRPENATEIGRTLNARYLLEGSVQSKGPRLRITAQLVDVTSGSQVWSLQFDRIREDVFKVQDEIALEVARALELSLDGAGGQMASRGAPGFDGYLAFLRGRALLAGLRTSDLPAAVEALEAATARDPGFVPAMVLLARARVALAEYQAVGSDYASVLQVVREGVSLLDQAIALEPDNGSAYVERGYLKAFTDLAAADADFRRGIELAPSLARGYEGLAAVLFQSVARRREALEFIEQARRLDPIDARLAVTQAVYSFYGAFDVDRAAGTLRSVLDRDPLYVPALARLAEVEWAGRGALAEAAVVAEQALALDPDNVFVRRLLVDIYLDLGDEGAAVSVLDPGRSSREAELQLHVYRSQWSEAGDIAAALIESGRAPMVQERGLALAVRNRARVTGNAAAAIELMETWTGLTWEDGEPVLGESLSMRMDLAGLAVLLQDSGDAARAAALAEEILRDIDQQAGRFARPAAWLDQARATALLILQRPDEALSVMLRLSGQGFLRHESRETLELDPVFDPIRADPAYRSAVAAVHEHASAERAALEEMRRQGLIPRRGPGTPAG